MDMNSLKQKVMHNAEKQRKDFLGSGSWLNQDYEFNHGLRLKKLDLERIKTIFLSCKVADRKENRLSFEILIANLIYHRGRRPVVVSLNTNNWKKNCYVKAGATTINLIYQLHEQGYMNLKKGYRTEKESRMSRIWPTDKLLEYFPKSHNFVINDPVELVILRDDKGKPKEYKDTEKTRRIRTILRKVNQINNIADICYEEYILSCSLVAIFNRKFTLYGRLHTRDLNHYQGLCGKERAKITINGDPVVEWDFSGLHPNLLYTKKGIQFEGDPYAIIDVRPEVREFLKYILLIMLNSKDEKAAVKAANKWLNFNYLERKKLNSIGITSSKPFIDAFKQAHEKINSYFFSDNETGLHIMNLDATIALDVINTFADQNIPILAIHDSFIVQEQYKDYLYTIMEKAYAKNTGGYRIRIKLK